MAFAADYNGMPIFDGTGAVLWIAPGGAGVADLAGVIHTVDAIGMPYDPADGTTLIAQPAMGTRVATLIQLTAQGTRTARLPMRFARTPARLDRLVIDYSTKAGMSLYDKGTKSLFEADEKFDLKSEDVVSFMDSLSHHAKKNGWDIFTINDGTVNKSLLTEYGELTLANVKAFIDPVIGAMDRQSQEDDQLFTCLMNSLAKGASSSST